MEVVLNKCFILIPGEEDFSDCNFDPIEFIFPHEDLKFADAEVSM